MVNKKTNLLIIISCFATLAVLWGFVYFMPTFPHNRVGELLFLFLTLVVLQFRGVGIAGLIKVSLSIAVYLSVIFVYGPTGAIALAILVSLLSGVVARLGLLKTSLNIVLKSFTCLSTGIVFAILHGWEASIRLPVSLPVMILCMLLYIAINIFLVSLFNFLLKGQPLSAVFQLLKPNILVNSIFFGYLGIAFSFIVSSLGNYGLIMFGILLMGISELFRYSLCLIAEQQRRIKAEQELVYDAKTKVYNYRYLSEWLDKEEIDKQTALLFIDIDDFKAFNDSYGHGYGDEVLLTVAQILKKLIRSEDRVIRFGGEEFVIILPNTTEARALQVAEKIHNKIADQAEIGLKHPITVSIGIATYSGQTMDRIDLLRRADMAMYQAKALGKNQSYVSN